MRHIIVSNGVTEGGGQGGTGADPGFLKGGGGPGGYRIFHKHPPLDIVRVTSSALRKIEKHPHSWTFTNTPPPPWTLPVWRHPHIQGGGVITPVTHTHPGSATGVHLRSTSKKGGGGSKRGSNFGPNVKKPTSWPKRGGPDPLEGGGLSGPNDFSNYLLVTILCWWHPSGPSERIWKWGGGATYQLGLTETVYMPTGPGCRPRFFKIFILVKKWGAWPPCPPPVPTTLPIYGGVCSVEVCFKPTKYCFLASVNISHGSHRLVQLIGSMSPWVLPERTLGTVRYTETCPGNYLICRTVPSLLQTVPSFETRIPDHRDICKRIARISVYRLKFLLGFTVSYSNPTLYRYEAWRSVHVYFKYCDISSGRNRDSQGTVESKQGTVRHIR